MLIWLFYDIRKNKIRALVARSCKQSGLRRMQKSVFAGKVDQAGLNKLRTEINRLVHPHTDIVHIQPVRQQDFHKLLRFGRQAAAPAIRLTGEVSFY